MINAISVIKSELLFWQQLSPFQIRRELEKRFPHLSPENYAILSESISISKQLSNKSFPFDFWLASQNTFEQATNFHVAEFHAQLLRDYSSHILDLCGGSGLDAVAFLQQNATVSSCEIDQAAYRKLQINHQLYGLNKWTIKPKSCLLENPKNYSALFIDPMRRQNQRRLVQLADYLPAISDLVPFLQSGKPLLYKTSPLLKITPEITHDFKLVFVSYQFECKEVLLVKNIPNLPERSIYISDSKTILDCTIPNHFQLNFDPDIYKKSKFIYEANPALLKSETEDFVLSQFDIFRPDKNCGYFFGNSLSVEHLVNTHYLIDNQFYKYSQLNLIVSQFSGEIIIKKKNTSVDIESIKLRKPKNKTNEKLILFLTELNGKTGFWSGKFVEH